jgi:hypothetical protein
MKLKELSALAHQLCGNSNYVSLDERPDLIDTVINHPDYSHMSQRSPWTLNIYFYCEGSPSGVSCFACIDVAKKNEILGKIDAITKALHF